MPESITQPANSARLLNGQHLATTPQPRPQEAPKPQLHRPLKLRMPWGKKPSADVFVRRPPALLVSPQKPARVAPVSVDSPLKAPLPPKGGVAPTLSIQELFYPIKEKFLFGEETITHFGKPLSFLHLQEASYITTCSTTHGAFGKIRFGVSKAWEVYIVKEFRIADTVCHVPGKKTASAPREQVIDELSRTLWLRNIIDTELARRERLLCGSNPYSSLRDGLEPLKLIDFQSVRFKRPDKDDVHKLYAVMTRQTGNLMDLRHHLPKRMRADACLSLAAQAYAELAIMHDVAQCAHLDISQGNVLFNRHGQFKLVDFGYSQELKNGSLQQKGLWGTLAAPEMVTGYVKGGKVQDPPDLTAAADVYALGVLIAHFASGYSWHVNPFAAPHSEEKARFDLRLAMLQKNFLHFEIWKDLHRVKSTGEVHPSLIREGQTDSFDKFFYGLASSSPKLCALLLNHALVLDPCKRATAAQLERQIRALLPTSNDLGMKILRAQMRRIEKQQGMEELRQAAQAFGAQVGHAEMLKKQASV